jgi:ankyrin repeat protein
MLELAVGASLDLTRAHCLPLEAAKFCSKLTASLHFDGKTLMIVAKGRTNSVLVGRTNSLAEQIIELEQGEETQLVDGDKLFLNREAMPLLVCLPGINDSEIAKVNVQLAHCVYHWSPLALASYTCNLPLLALLIQQGANVNEQRVWHALPSVEGAAVGFIEGLELLKEKGCDLSKGDSSGLKPVHCAAAGGHLPLLCLLFSWNVPMQAQDNGLNDVAHYAAFQGRHDIIQQLHNWGLPLNRLNLDGFSPADVADVHGAAAGCSACGDLIRRLLQPDP